MRRRLVRELKENLLLAILVVIVVLLAAAANYIREHGYVAPLMLVGGLLGLSIFYQVIKIILHRRKIALRRKALIDKYTDPKAVDAILSGEF